MCAVIPVSDRGTWSGFESLGATAEVMKILVPACLWTPHLLCAPTHGCALPGAPCAVLSVCSVVRLLCVPLHLFCRAPCGVPQAPALQSPALAAAWFFFARTRHMLCRCTKHEDAACQSAPWSRGSCPEDWIWSVSVYCACFVCAVTGGRLVLCVLSLLLAGAAACGCCCCCVCSACAY